MKNRHVEPCVGSFGLHVALSDEERGLVCLGCGGYPCLRMNDIHINALSLPSETCLACKVAVDHMVTEGFIEIEDGHSVVADSWKAL